MPRLLDKWSNSLRKRVPALRAYLPDQAAQRLERMITAAQPADQKAQCLLTFLTRGGLGASGKVDPAAFLPAFCSEMRRHGVRTQFCLSHEEIAWHMRRCDRTILLHLFGEDNYQINSCAISALEDQAVAVFNSARTGAIIADKRRTEDCLTPFGVRFPPPPAPGGTVFVRQRLGSKAPTRVIEEWEGAKDSLTEDEVGHALVDTRLVYKNREYFTLLRLLCVDDQVVHTLVRARDVAEDDPNVHASDTPVDPNLFEHLHEQLVRRKKADLDDLAAKAFQGLGHGFYGHDVLIDRETGTAVLCETTFKFDTPITTKALAGHAESIPSQAPIIDTVGFAERSARAALRSVAQPLGLTVPDEASAEAG